MVNELLYDLEISEPLECEDVHMTWGGERLRWWIHPYMAPRAHKMPKPVIGLMHKVYESGVFKVRINELLTDLKEKIEATHTSVISRVFAGKAYGINGVKAVYSKVDHDGACHIWTVVTKDNFGVREQVYDVEAALYNLFPDAPIDFYVLSLERLLDRNLDMIIPNGFTLVSGGITDAIGYATPPTGRA